MKQSIIIAALLATAASAFAPSSRFAVHSTSLKAADWKPTDGGKWEEKDYESELKKLEKEAEDRLDAKIAEMMSKIETTGAEK